MIKQQIALRLAAQEVLSGRRVYFANKASEIKRLMDGRTLNHAKKGSMIILDETGVI